VTVPSYGRAEPLSSSHGRNWDYRIRGTGRAKPSVRLYTGGTVDTAIRGWWGRPPQNRLGDERKAPDTWLEVINWTQIMNTKVLLTMVGGKTVYAAKQFR
jgi:hypothetical protein